MGVAGWLGYPEQDWTGSACCMLIDVSATI